jgi:hypothetical protein
MTKKLLLNLLCAILIVFSVNAQSINNSFFEKVKYIGAFGSTDWTAGWANFDPINTNYGTPTSTLGNSDKTVAGGLKITTNTSISGIVKLDGWVYIKSGAKLTIAAGTIVRGTPASCLVIEPGAQIIAEGTSSNPIVFTSMNGAGNRGPSDWGGLIICGNAQINSPSKRIIEGGVGTEYGGANGDTANNNESSGILKYVRIEFAGYDVDGKGNEINGLTMGGVGRGTTIDYVQVSYSGDDAFEWFGGTVNCKHLIAYHNEDDDFDTDYGYQGLVQFAVTLRDTGTFDTDKSRAFESDNDANSSNNKPYTSPVFSNVSAFGPYIELSTPQNPSSTLEAALYLRRNSRIQIYNSVFAGWKYGLIIDGSGSQSAAIHDSLKIYNCIFAGMKTNFDIKGGTMTKNDLKNWFMESSRQNDTLVTNNLLLLNNPFNYTNPNFLPKENSPVLVKSTWKDIVNYVEKTNISDGITIYPNPADNFIYINYNDVLKVTISNINGYMLKTIEAENKISVSDLPKGMYLLNILTSNGNTYNKKFIKK